MLTADELARRAEAAESRGALDLAARLYQRAYALRADPALHAAWQAALAESWDPRVTAAPIPPPDRALLARAADAFAAGDHARVAALLEPSRDPLSLALRARALGTLGQPVAAEQSYSRARTMWRAAGGRAELGVYNGSIGGAAWRGDWIAAVEVGWRSPGWLQAWRAPAPSEPWLIWSDAGDTRELSAWPQWIDGGRHFAVGSEAAVHVYEPVTGTLVRRFEAHPDRVQTIIASSDGSHLLTASMAGGALRVWRADGSLRGEVEPVPEMNAMALRGPSAEVAMGDLSGDIVTVGVPANAHKPRKLRPGFAPPGPELAVTALGYASDGALLSGHVGGWLLRWEPHASRPRVLRASPCNGQDGCSAVPSSFSPDGRFAAIGDREIFQVWEIEHAALVASLGGIAWGAASFDDSGTRVVVENQLVTLANGTSVALGTREASDAPDIFRDTQAGPFVSRGGKRLLHDEGSRARLWDFELGRDLWVHEGDASLLALSLDGSLVALTTGEMVELWDATQGRRVAHVPHRAHRAAHACFSADSRTAAIAVGRRVLVWRRASGAFAAVDATHPVVDVALSDDGARVAATTEAPAAEVWEGDQLVPLAYLALGGETRLEFTAARRLVLAGGLSLFAWDLTSGARTHGDGSTIYELFSTSDGRVLTAGRGIAEVVAADTVAVRPLFSTPILPGDMRQIEPLPGIGVLLVTAQGIVMVDADGVELARVTLLKHGFLTTSAAGGIDAPEAVRPLLRTRVRGAASVPDYVFGPELGWPWADTPGLFARLLAGLDGEPFP